MRCFSVLAAFLDGHVNDFGEKRFDYETRFRVICGNGSNRAAIAAMDELFAAAFFKFRRAAKIVEQTDRGVNAFPACVSFYSIE